MYDKIMQVSLEFGVDLTNNRRAAFFPVDFSAAKKELKKLYALQAA